MGLFSLANWFELHQLFQISDIQFRYAYLENVYENVYSVANLIEQFTDSSGTRSYLVLYLHFQVPKLKKSALMISLVPDDVGKPTVRLEKAAIQDGTCSWENPIYETVKLIRDSKTGKLNEKIYHFIVATVRNGHSFTVFLHFLVGFPQQFLCSLQGSSKSGYLGEASIDFADFEAETKPLTVSLPLKFANSGAVLHVTLSLSLSLSRTHTHYKLNGSSFPGIESSV